MSKKCSNKDCPNPVDESYDHTTGKWFTPDTCSMHRMCSWTCENNHKFTMNEEEYVRKGCKCPLCGAVNI